MHTPHCIRRLLAASLLFTSPSLCAAEKETFDTAETGKLPAGWLAAVTGAGQPKWLVDADPVGDAKNRVLKQIGSADYPL